MAGLLTWCAVVFAQDFPSHAPLHGPERTFTPDSVRAALGLSAPAPSPFAGPLAELAKKALANETLRDALKETAKQMAAEGGDLKNPSPELMRDLLGRLAKDPAALKHIADLAKEWPQPKKAPPAPSPLPGRFDEPPPRDRQPVPNDPGPATPPPKPRGNPTPNPQAEQLRERVEDSPALKQIVEDLRAPPAGDPDPAKGFEQRIKRDPQAREEFAEALRAAPPALRKDLEKPPAGAAVRPGARQTPQQKLENAAKNLGELARTAPPIPAPDKQSGEPSPALPPRQDQPPAAPPGLPDGIPVLSKESEALAREIVEKYLEQTRAEARPGRQDQPAEPRREPPAGAAEPPPVPAPRPAPWTNPAPKEAPNPAGDAPKPFDFPVAPVPQMAAPAADGLLNKLTGSAAKLGEWSAALGGRLAGSMPTPSFGAAVNGDSFSALAAMAPNADSARRALPALAFAAAVAFGAWLLLRARKAVVQHAAERAARQPPEVAALPAREQAQRLFEHAAWCALGDAALPKNHLRVAPDIAPAAAAELAALYETARYAPPAEPFGAAEAERVRSLVRNHHG